MSQPSISKHLKVLEGAGLISRGRDKQRRPCRLEAKPLAEANEWLEGYRRFWENRFQALDALLDELQADPAKARRAEARRPLMRNLAKLKVTTPSDREIVMTRDFNAPRSLVFDCWTKPELVRRWLLGPAGWSMPVCRIDLRVGGAYRFEWRHILNGYEMAMGGIYHEIAPPDRLVCTESFDEKWYTRRRARHDGVHRTKRHDHARADHTLRVQAGPRHGAQFGDGERRHRQFRPARRPVGIGSHRDRRLTASSPRHSHHAENPASRRLKCRRSPRSCGSTTRPKRP